MKRSNLVLSTICLLIFCINYITMANGNNSLKAIKLIKGIYEDYQLERKNLHEIEIEMQTEYCEIGIDPSTESASITYTEDYYHYTTRLGEFISDNNGIIFINHIGKQVILAPPDTSVISQHQNLFFENIDSLLDNNIFSIEMKQDSIINFAVISDSFSFPKNTKFVYILNEANNIKSYSIYYVNHPTIKSMTTNFINMKQSKLTRKTHLITVKYFIDKYIKEKELLSPYADYELYNNIEVAK